MQHTLLLVLAGAQAQQAQLDKPAQPDKPVRQDKPARQDKPVLLARLARLDHW